jgi:hypothetical protein
VNDAVVAEAWKKDNRHKLGSARSLEKHFVVYICPDNHRVWTPFVYLAPPDYEVDLPPEITHIWAISEGEAAHQFVVWCARTGERWRSLGIVNAYDYEAEAYQSTTDPSSAS